MMSLFCLIPFSSIPPIFDSHLLHTPIFYGLYVLLLKADPLAYWRPNP
jgi:hypothetical protein